jgi:hypothetical protein
VSTRLSVSIRMSRLKVMKGREPVRAEGEGGMIGGDLMDRQIPLRFHSPPRQSHRF